MPQLATACSCSLSLREAEGFDFNCADDEQACLVWDAREDLAVYQAAWLEAFFAQTDRLVITHWIELDIIAQSQLLRQLRSWFDGQLFYAHTLDAKKATSLLTLPFAHHKPCDYPGVSLVSLRLSLGRVVLDHLLFVLEMVQQNGQRPIWRAQALLDTQEYVNPVVIDMTHSQLRTHGAAVEPFDPLGMRVGDVTFWLDSALDQAQLREWLVASLAPGERIGI